MNPLLVFTVLPLGIFLTWASISMLRQKWMYLLVADSFLPGKPSLAMLPNGILMMLVPFSDWITALPKPLSGMISILLIICLAAALIGCFWMPRSLQPQWMKDSDERLKNGTDAAAATYRHRLTGLPAPDEQPRGPQHDH